MVKDDEATEEKKEKSNGSTKMKKESNSLQEGKYPTIDNDGDDKMEDVPASSPGDKDEIHGKNGIKRLSLKEEKAVDTSNKIDKTGLYNRTTFFAKAYMDSFPQEKITCQRNTTIVL